MITFFFEYESPLPDACFSLPLYIYKNASRTTSQWNKYHKKHNYYKSHIKKLFHPHEPSISHRVKCYGAPSPPLLRLFISCFALIFMRIFAFIMCVCVCVVLFAFSFAHRWISNAKRETACSAHRMFIISLSKAAFEKVQNSMLKRIRRRRQSTHLMRIITICFS